MQHTSHGQMHNKLAYQHSADSRQRDPHTGVHSNNNASHHHAYTQAGPNGSFASFETPQYAQKHEGIVSGVSEGLQGPQFMQFGPPLPSGSYYTGNGTQFANPPAFTLEGTLFPPASSAMDNDPPKSFAAHSMANGFVFSPSPFSADLGPIQSPESSFLNYSHLRAFESNLKKSDLLNPSAQNLQYPNPMLTYESSSLDSSPPLSAELGSAENVLAHSSAHELIGQDLALLMDLSDQEVTVDFSSVHQLPTSYGPATHSISPTQLAEPQQSHCVCATNTAPGYLLPESTELAPSPAERNASASPAQSCSCGPGCECLLCATHPYNHTSIQHIQQLEHIMDEDDARNCSEHHLMGSGRNSPSPFEIHDLVSSTAQMTTEHLPSPVKGMHEDRRNPQDSDVSDMSRTRNASDYYHFEYHLKTVEDPVLVGMPCGNSGCVCGEDCACEGCPTHGNASIYPFARVITSESMVGDAAVDHSIEIGVRDHKDPLDATDDFTSAFWLAAEQQDASQDSLSYR
ncbi:hypothetical protein MMC13_003051 [Lambiella insularis]|nr:hypothetical protein [Lambiella insularis]